MDAIHKDGGARLASVLLKSLQMSPAVGSHVAPLNSAQEELLATACHKLRTPLTAAMGYLQLALRDARRSDGRSSAHLDAIDQQLRRMASMLDELASKIDSQ